MSDDSKDPFAVLKIAPTLDARAVRVAWAQAVRAHPPHADPEGFRRARAAYEQLQHARDLRAAWLSAPFSPVEARRGYEAEDEAKLAGLRERLAVARAGQAADRAREAAPQRFGQVLATWTLAQWLARRGGGDGTIAPCR